MVPIAPDLGLLTCGVLSLGIAALLARLLLRLHHHPHDSMKACLRKVVQSLRAWVWWQCPWPASRHRL